MLLKIYIMIKDKNKSVSFKVQKNPIKLFFSDLNIIRLKVSSRKDIHVKIRKFFFIMLHIFFLIMKAST